MNASTLRHCALMLFLLAGAPAFAQTGSRPADRSRDHEHVTYGYAQVMRVEPIYLTVNDGRTGLRCDTRRPGGDPVGGTVAGAIIGGAIGNQTGKGDGRKAATIAGAVAGAAIGRSIDRSTGSNPQQRVECSSSGYYETRQIVGYDVEYQYKGDRYVSRLAHDPGNRIRVRVSVTPDEQPRGSR